MRTAAIVKVEIPINRASRLTDCFVGSQIDFLVFDAAPKPFDKHIVPPGPFAIHADGDTVIAKHPVNAVPVNCEPWSVLKISGFP